MNRILVDDIINMLNRYKVDEETLDDELRNEIDALITRIDESQILETNNDT